MIRNIIKINEEKCIGCGLCVNACKEGAIGLVDGKAKLLREDYCDGLGNCLPACPTNAISFVEREADAYNEDEAKMRKAALASQPETLPCGCPGTNSKTIERIANLSTNRNEDILSEGSQSNATPVSQLNQWPVQIKLAPVNAPYFDNAKLLIAADCTAYAYAGIHNEFMKGKITLIGCPKLDEGDYAEKLSEILKTNNIKSVTVLRMEVPCCAGIANAVITALKNSEKMIPWSIVTISTDGQIIDE